MSIEIIRVCFGDIPLFNRVAEDVFDGPIIPEQLIGYLSQPSHRMVVALSAGEIVGQCAAVIHRHPDKPDELYLDEVGVCRRYRRQKIATQMIKKMIVWGRELGCSEAWVGTDCDNSAAQALYGHYTKSETFFLYAWDI